jgi:hypothetical protein
VNEETKVRLLPKNAQKVRNEIFMAIEKAFCFGNERCFAIAFFELVFFVYFF